ncbi:UNVERIFIED_CONTAM: hypothetical protein Slati_3935000 [Sesamum latifolium]|uniref:Uncharacterized protein n=1 Tax=Sesamum latifolium TaxID=2727402 RepID=A0AAW2TRM7_9LAMI
MLMYFAARARRASNLETGFLAKDLKKSQSKSPCEGTSVHLLGGGGHLQDSSIESLQVLLQGLIVILSYGKETNFSLLEFSTTGELV